MLGTNDVFTYNCLTKNGQYGFQCVQHGRPAQQSRSPTTRSATTTRTTTQPTTPGCGCAGGAKFWDTNGATVTGNYVHDNEDVGLWADTDNRGFDISYNYIPNNYAEGIMYEISYNALDLAQRPRWQRPRRSARPSRRTLVGAIYISESGSDSRVPGPYGDTFAITDNIFTTTGRG